MAMARWQELSPQGSRRRQRQPASLALSLALAAASVGVPGASAAATAAAATTLRGSVASHRSDTAETRRGPPWAPEFSWRGGRPYGGRTFGDSPAAVNHWGSSRLPPGIGGVEAEAPFDRVDSPWQASIIGAMPASPGGAEGAGPQRGFEAAMTPDFVEPPTDTFLHGGVPSKVDSPMVPIGDRSVVAKPDRLRTGGIFGREAYPLVAPADSAAGGPLPRAHADRVVGETARYLSHVRGEGVNRAEYEDMYEDFHAADTDRSNSISRQEFDAELAYQGKSEQEAGFLWSRYHSANTVDMTAKEFLRLSRNGFDIGYINRTDLSSVMLPSRGLVDRGYWGTGAACPPGTFATGARLRRELPSQDAGSDNTGLNSVALRCGGPTGVEIQSADGGEGSWSPWVDCPAGSFLNAVRVKTQKLDYGIDASGVNDIEFECANAGNPTVFVMTFPMAAAGVPASAVNAAGVQQGALAPAPAPASAQPVPQMEGAWSSVYRCDPKDKNTGTEAGLYAICGVQVRLRSDQDEGDDMGVTDVRLYCCEEKDD